MRFNIFVSVIILLITQNHYAYSQISGPTAIGVGASGTSTGTNTTTTANYCEEYQNAHPGSEETGYRECVEASGISPSCPGGEVVFPNGIAIRNGIYTYCCCTGGALRTHDCSKLYPASLIEACLTDQTINGGK